MVVIDSVWGDCQGGGPWSAQEKTLHINSQELLVATLALLTFAKDRRGISVLLRIDNTTAERSSLQETYLGLMDVVPGEENPHPSSTPPSSTQPRCQCEVSDDGGLHRLKAGSSPIPIQQDQSAIWATKGRPIFLQTHLPVPALFQLVARSLCICIPTGLVIIEGVCQPSMESGG